MTDLAALPVEATLPPRVPLVVGQDAQPEDRPDYERAALTRMRQEWELGDLLMGGTKAMHEARTKVLVQEQDETPEEFTRRSQRVQLTNYYGDTVERHSGLPFGKPIVFDPPLPERLHYLETNCDGAGRSITAFAREALREGILRGLTHLLVDAKPGSGETYADVLKRRPVLLHIKPGDALDMEDEPTQTGDEHVVMARLRQCQMARKGTFGAAPDESILVLDAKAKTATRFRKSGDTWTTEENPYPRDSVPLFTFYASQVDEYEGRPAYASLRDLNLLHYQSDCEQRHGLSYGRRSTLVQTGWDDESNAAEAAAKGKKPEKRAALGWARRLRTKSKEANAYFLETGGAGLAAGDVDLKDIVERMERFGAQQVSKGGGITATSRKLDNQRDTCNLEAWCTRLEAVLLAAVRALAEWAKVPLPANQRLQFDRTFADESPGTTEVPLLIQMAEKRQLPVAVLLREVKARGLLRTVDDPESLVEQLAEEAEKLAVFDMERLAQEAIAERAGHPAPTDEPETGAAQPDGDAPRKAPAPNDPPRRGAPPQLGRPPVPGPRA